MVSVSHGSNNSTKGRVAITIRMTDLRGLLRKQETMPLGVPQEKLMVNPGFPFAQANKIGGQGGRGKGGWATAGYA